MPVDERARAAAGGGLAGWLAAVAGGELRERTHAPADALAVDPRLEGLLDRTGLEVGAVAAAVDAGRALAARAAADGITVVVATGGTPGPAQALARWLAGDRPEDIRGPLGALRRLGDGHACVLTGLALGAGEHGLGCLCDGLPAMTAADLAATLEPELWPRVLGAEPMGVAAALALLRRAAASP